MGGGRGAGGEGSTARGPARGGSSRAAPSARPSGCGAARDPRRAAVRGRLRPGRGDVLGGEEGGRGSSSPSRLFTARFFKPSLRAQVPLLPSPQLHPPGKRLPRGAVNV